MKMPKTMNFCVDIEMNEIIQRLSFLDEDSVFKFIVKLELACENYDLAERLRDHFIKVVEKETIACSS